MLHCDYSLPAPSQPAQHPMTDTARFDLYAFWRTSATCRVRVAFNLKGVQPNEINVNLEAGEQRSEAYLRINPMGAIPALIDNAPDQPKTLITQSLAILEFIEETHPTPALLPVDAHGRARVRSLATLLAADTHPLVTPRVKKYLSSVGGFDEAAWRAWQIQWFTTGLQALEQRLASIVVLTRLFKIELPELPHVQRIMAACEQLDAFARAAPGLQAGAPQA